MSTFYFPLTLTIFDIPVIVYPMIGVEQIVSQSDPNSLQNHLTNLYTQNPDLQAGAYHIVILWNNDGILMSGVWVFLQLETQDTGFTIDCLTFEEMTPVSGEGITASDGLIMLGYETEISENLRKQQRPISEYILGPRPELPQDLNPSQSFYNI